MTKRNALWRMLVVLSLAALAEAAGAGQAQAYVTAYHAEEPTVRQGTAMPPAVGNSLLAGIPRRQNGPASESGVQSGKVIKMIAPIYPPAAIQAHISGVVIVDARVGADGRIVAVNAVSGPRALRRVAEYAVRHWRYEPSFLNGRPVERVAQMDLRFVLDRN